MTKSHLKNKKILITYGPTWVPIDDVRVISNRSSGKMGKFIIENLVKTGAKITALEGPINDPIRNKKIRIKKFTFFDEFAELFKAELKKKYDVVIHAAAVSDFKPTAQSRSKISSNKQIKLTLRPTEKLIGCIKKLAPGSFLVGFKLESTACQRKLKKEALKLIKKNHCDIVVANSLKTGYSGFIFNNEGALVAKEKTRKSIGRRLAQQLQNLQ